MTTGTATTPSNKEDRTIILPISQENYEKIVAHPQKIFVRLCVVTPPRQGFRATGRQ